MPEERCFKVVRRNDISERRVSAAAATSCLGIGMRGVWQIYVDQWGRVRTVRSSLAFDSESLALRWADQNCGRDVERVAGVLEVWEALAEELIPVHWVMEPSTLWREFCTDGELDHDTIIERLRGGHDGDVVCMPAPRGTLLAVNLRLIRSVEWRPSLPIVMRFESVLRNGSSIG